MVGGRSPYLAGYAFEAKVRDRLRAKSYHVVRQHGSAFPDLYCLPKKEDTTNKPLSFAEIFDMRPLIIECKKAKYLSKEEKLGLAALKPFGTVLVAYPELNKNDKRMTDVVLADPSDYKEITRLY